MVDSGMNRESAGLLQRLAVEATGSKIFKDLDRTFTKARWSALHEAGTVSEIEMGKRNVSGKRGDTQDNKKKKLEGKRSSTIDEVTD